jgi:hypothetical protein
MRRNVCVCMWVGGWVRNIYTSMHLLMYTHICIYASIHYIYASTHLCIYKSIHLSIYACMHVSLSVCVCLSFCVSVCLHAVHMCSALQRGDTTKAYPNLPPKQSAIRVRPWPTEPGPDQWCEQ